MNLLVGFRATSNVGDLKVNRDDKQQFVAEMREVFEGSEGVIITQYKGLTVSEITDLRAQP